MYTYLVEWHIGGPMVHPYRILPRILFLFFYDVSYMKKRVIEKILNRKTYFGP